MTVHISRRLGCALAVLAWSKPLVGERVDIEIEVEAVRQSEAMVA
jgi:hypothetical protein